MLKKEMTKEFKTYTSFLESTIISYLKDNKLNYKHHFIMHSFSNEFIVKVYLYPKKTRNATMSQVCIINFYKENDLITFQKNFDNRMKRFEKKEMYKETEYIIQELINYYKNVLIVKNETTLKNTTY